jgi:carbamoyltransferase
VAFYDKPVLKFERLCRTYLAFAPRGFSSFRRAVPLWVREKLHLPREMRRILGERFRGRFVFPEHHESHAASAFFPSPYRRAAILTLDGVGEWTTSALGVGEGNRMELLQELRFPHSLGLFYSTFTDFAGFRVNSGEYKLMGLAPYGEPRFVKPLLDEVIDLKEDGSFRLDLSYFGYCHGLTMSSAKLERLLGGPPRHPESDLTQREMDIAASVQAITEEIMLRCARFLARETKARHVVLAGGVALNCVGNGRILRDGCFEDLWIQPAANDAGGALGAALFVWHQLLDRPRDADDVTDRQAGSLLGPAYGDDEVRTFLDGAGAVYRHYPDEDLLLEEITRHLVQERVVAVLQGRMEFGPRALGNRSILGDPRSPRMQSTMNLKIKFRESFRPFAPSVLRDHAHEWFDLPRGKESPYMLLVAPVHERRRTGRDDPTLFGLERLAVERSTIPAVTHVDYSARVQTVDERHGRYFRLLRHFADATGCPVLINTSFNIRGEPIVCSPEDAYRCFLGSNIDVLVIERFLLRREEQPRLPTATEMEAYKAQFTLD